MEWLLELKIDGGGCSVNEHMFVLWMLLRIQEPVKLHTALRSRPKVQISRINDAIHDPDDAEDRFTAGEFFGAVQYSPRKRFPTPIKSYG
jgi:hypothetical protein